MEDEESPNQETEAWVPIPSLPGTQENLEQVLSECQAFRVSLGKCRVGLGDSAQGVKDSLCRPRGRSLGGRKRKCYGEGRKTGAEVRASSALRRAARKTANQG